MISSEKYLLLKLWMIILLLSSCSHYYYVPSAQNVPLFKEKGELKLNGMLGAEASTTSLQLQTAYSLTNHLGVLANYSRVKGGEVNEGDWGKGTVFEFGGGVYNRFAEKGVVELYGGYGVCTQYHEYYFNFSNCDLKMNRIFIQPSVGFCSNGFDVSFSSKILWMNIADLTFKLDSFNLPYPFQTYTELSLLRENPRSVFFEPALTIRAGWKSVKIQAQLVGSVNLSQSIQMPYDDGSITIGLYLTIPTKGNPTPKTENLNGK